MTGAISLPGIFPHEGYSEYCLVREKLLQAMITNPRTKRILSISLLVLGGMLMFFAPENIWIGAILFALGVGVEIAAWCSRTAMVSSSNSEYGSASSGKRRGVRGGASIISMISVFAPSTPSKAGTGSQHKKPEGASGFGFKVSTYKGGITHSNIDIIKLSSIKSSFLEETGVANQIGRPRCQPSQPLSIQSSNLKTRRRVRSPSNPSPTSIIA